MITIIEDKSRCNIKLLDYYASEEGLDSAVVLGTERLVTIVCKPRYGIVFCVMSSVFCSFGTVQNNSRGRSKTYMYMLTQNNYMEGSGSATIK